MLLQWVVSVCPVTIPTSLPVFLRVKAPFLPCFLLQLFARRLALLPASRPPFLRTLISVSEAADEHQSLIWRQASDLPLPHNPL